MIKNKTRKTILCSDEKILTHIWQEAMGLMFTLTMKKPLVFTFPKEKKQSFHMLFVFYPIDLLFLDKHMKVVEIKENFKPFKFYNSKNCAKYVIELPVDKIRKTNTNVGDIITIIK
jgi:uncharacterized protein